MKVFALAYFLSFVFLSFFFRFEEYVREGKAVPYLEFLLVKIRSELYKSVCPPKFDFHSASLKKVKNTLELCLQLSFVM